MSEQGYTPSIIISRGEQVRVWDRATLAAEGIASIELMQRAVGAVVQRFVLDYPPASHKRVDVLIGPGDNGGDGAGVAGALAMLGYSVRAYRYGAGAGSADLEQMWTRLGAGGNVACFRDDAYATAQGVHVVVDALFGVGTSRPLEGDYAKTVAAMNGGTVPVVSIDVPSGQSIDGRHPDWPNVHATHTYTFGAIKYSALLSDTGPAWGTPVVLDIGLIDPGRVPELRGADDPTILTPTELGNQLSPRRRFTHKGTWGHVLVMAGSRGHAGAALLAGTGAYRAGAGLVTFYVPSDIESILQVGLPEAMTIADPGAGHLCELLDIAPYDSVVIGPGLGKHLDTAAVLRDLFEVIGETPLVIDADALNLLSLDRRLSAKLPPNAVLTPHPGEFARLVGRELAGGARLAALQKYVAGLGEPNAVVVLKDQYTVLAKAERRAKELDGVQAINFYYGNPGMGTGGMGDVLSGVIGAQLARGLSTWDAARLGVYLHARAGDSAARVLGERALLAGDLAKYLGHP